jgi:hypothetical protein
MEKVELAKEIVKAITNEEIPIRGAYEGTSYEAKFADDKTTVTLDGEDFEVIGTKRLQAKPKKAVTKKKQVQKKAKPKKKEPVNLDKKCSECGKDFTVSKFNPYFDKCPECRRGKSSGVGIEKKCEKCNKIFTTSKFTPYQKYCQECSKTHRLENLAKLKKTPAKKASKNVSAKKKVSSSKRGMIKK